MRLIVVVFMLFATSLLLAQRIEPTSLSFEAVPPNTSPQEGLAFTNTGTTQLTLTVSVSAPFAVAENRCGNGVRPGTHCNVYLTYLPQIVGEADSGTLTVNYGGGAVTVPLSGQGVSAIPTYVSLHRSQCSIIRVGHTFSMLAEVAVSDKYYALPVGESVATSCTNGSEKINLGDATLVRCRKHHCPSGPYAEASFTVTPDQAGNWSCTVVYDGDGILSGGAGSVGFTVVEHGSHCY